MIMIISLIVILILTLIIFISFYYRFSYGGRLIHKIPGPRALPVLGNTFDVALHPEALFKFLRQLYKEHGPLSRLQAFHYRLVNVYDPEDLEVLLSTAKYHGKGLPYSFLNPWLGKGMLTNNGAKWYQRRKLLKPAFHLKILKKFCRTFTERTENIVEQLHTAAGDKTDLMPFISKHTLRIMCETSMGTSMNEGIVSVTNKYLNGLIVLGHCLLYRLTRTWLYIDNVFRWTRTSTIQKKAIDDLHRFTKKIIKERREYVQNQTDTCVGELAESPGKNRLAILDLLLDQEKKGRIDEEGIRAEIDIFMFAGHDTTATALCFLIMRIANEPEVQERIHEEQRLIFGNSDRSPTMEDLTEMKYLECCIKECLRLYPSVPFIARHVKEDLVLAGYRIPANTVYNIHIFDIHRRADLYPEPEKFIPERFLPENTAKRHTYAYIPFSAGPRNCIGQKFAFLEMKTVMSGLMRRFRLLPVTRPDQLVFTCDIVLRTRDPIYVAFQKRNQPDESSTN